MAPEASTLVERYVLESRIAGGGMGMVWRARDDVLARTVAVKILHAHLAEDPSFLSRFRHEALAAARLTHPHIVAIYDTGSEPGEQEGPDQHFIVMEYCGGGTLLDLLQRSGPLSPEKAVNIAATTCDALSYAHTAGVTHRDIKPANVLLTDNGILKVADFGIAKAAFSSGDITTTGAILGSVTYLSPEQAAGEEPGPRADLYSLGVVTYQLLVGRPPFEEATDIATALGHLHDTPPPLRAIRAGIPRSLDAAVTKALAKAPEDRYGSAEEMKTALVNAVGGTGETQAIRYAPPAHHEHPIDAEQGSPSGFFKTEGRRIAPIVLLVLVAVIAAALIAALADQEPDEGANRNGGNGGNNPASDGIEIVDASDFDPSGDGQEHPELVHLAHDGDPSTLWRTETYRASLSEIDGGKPGVGLVFDLGESVALSEVIVAFDAPGYGVEIRSGDDDPEDHEDLSGITNNGSVAQEQSFSLDGAEGRYWLIWITSLREDGGGRAQVAEVEFVGT